MILLPTTVHRSIAAAVVLACPCTALASPIAMDSDGQSLVEEATWDASTSELRVEVKPEMFIHVRANRLALFRTGRVPLSVLGEASGMKAVVRTFGEDGVVLYERPFATSTGTPGAVGGFGFAVSGADAARAIVVIKLLDGDGQAANTRAHGCGLGADVNCDGIVNAEDLIAFLERVDATDTDADVDGDGCVTQLDVLEFINVYDRFVERDR